MKNYQSEWYQNIKGKEKLSFRRNRGQFPTDYADGFKWKSQIAWLQNILLMSGSKDQGLLYSTIQLSGSVKGVKVDERLLIVATLMI